MDRKFISIDVLKKVLSPKEMKNVLGGSSTCQCGCNYGDGYFVKDCSCAGSPSECIGYDPPPGCVIISC